MNKKRKSGRLAAVFMALSVLTGNMGLSSFEKPMTASAASSNQRFAVDLNKNDGRKASYARWAENWIVSGDSSASATINGIGFKLSASGGSLRMENNKKLQQMSGIYPRLTMDGATVDANNGGSLKLEISGLSAGTHSIRTYHSATGNESVGGLTVTINGQKISGVKCPNQVATEDDAGMAWASFNVTSGQTITVEIKPEGSGNAWLNGFEIDGGDPINGVSHVLPADQEKHHEGNTLSWKAGKNAKSHDVYIGTDYDDVNNAGKSSAEYMGNVSGTSYELDDSYDSPTTYYWRVDTIDSSGNTVKGSVHSFNVARLAFPTAEGYGRFARGGQGGIVVHVTNLNDSGEGSLRWALCDSRWQTDDWKGVPRIVVFDVGGVIKLNSTLCIPDNAGSVYVAGQTAPGDGITLINHDFGAMGSEDVIIRDIRTRVGDTNGQSTGGMGLSSCNHTIVDHCSISWATDEGFSSRQAANITFQWNIIGETLNDSVHYNADNRNETECHSFAASIGGYTGSYHHNLLVHNAGRNWSLAGAMEQDAIHYGGQADIRNNLVYNWQHRTTDGGVRRLNFVNNYYMGGPASNTGLHVVMIDGNELNTSDMQMMYVSGNVMTKQDGSYVLKSTDDAWAMGKAKSGGKNSTNETVRSDTPFFESYVETQSAEEAAELILAGAGAGGTSSAGWDYIDSRYIKDVSNRSYTYKGSKQGIKGIIDSQNDVGGYPNSSNFAHSTDGICNEKNDTDRDGMPNTWEQEHGLDPNDASDGAICTLSADGYTNVEMFLNELMGDPVDYNGNGGSSIKKGAVIDTSVKYSITNVGSGITLSSVSNDAIQSVSGEVRWSVETADNGYYYIISESGQYLTLENGALDNGTDIIMSESNKNDAQMFKFVKNKDGSYTIYTKSTEDTSCLGVESGSAADGADVIQWESDGTDSQKWIMQIKLDPISGNLIEEIEPFDAAYYGSWSIDTSLEVGDQVFGDRTGDKLVTFADIPDELIGAEYVITPCDAKTLTTDVAMVTAGADITLYIGLDSRTISQYGVPAWMSGWTDSGLVVTHSKDVSFNMYSIELAKGESVTVGQNGGSSGCVFYTIMATPAVTSSKLIGDVNADGKFTVADVVMMQKWLLHAGSLTDWTAGDLREDGRIDAFDLCIMKRELLKQ